MTFLSVRGTAKERWLKASASENAVNDEPRAAGSDPEDFEPAYLGWEVARCAPGLSAQEQRGLAALAAACVESIRSGSTRLPLDSGSLIAALTAVGAPDVRATVGGLLARARSPLPADAVSAVVGRPGERKPLILDGEWLYAERMYALEERFCVRVRERLARGTQAKGKPEGRAAARAVSAVASGPPTLTEEQKRAVREGLTAPLVLVTGGPGTGKTATAVALLRALAWLGVSMEQIAIGAPTGKAAQRLADAIALGLAESRDLADAGLRAISPRPQTLHRLLGWSPSRGRFARHENDPLSQKVVVVDEASMIDLSMMDRLVRALREDARLVLLGDADQLPSVEAGAVFRDLCAGLGAIRLTANLRVASDASARRIVAATRAVNLGAERAIVEESLASRTSVDQISFEGVEHLPMRWSEVGRSFLDRWWTGRIAHDAAFAERAKRTYRWSAGRLEPDDEIALHACFEDYASARLLCVTRVRGLPTSADEINDRLLARLRGLVAGPLPRARSELCPGALVTVQRNDYERGLYNGDHGVVVRMAIDGAEDDKLMVAFRRESTFEVFALDVLHDLAPAFAMTVHKAQGSEFDHVALVLPDGDLPLLTRELVYTAMTRARRSVVLVGEGDLLARAVSRVVVRHSGIAARLEAR